VVIAGAAVDLTRVYARALHISSSVVPRPGLNADAYHLAAKAAPIKCLLVLCDLLAKDKSVLGWAQSVGRKNQKLSASVTKAMVTPLLQAINLFVPKVSACR